jgi:hypothetical protein
VLQRARRQILAFGDVLQGRTPFDQRARDAAQAEIDG